MELSQFFHEHPRVALAFSGGVDSAFLLYAAINSGAKVKAYYVKSAFQPRFELEDAQKLAKQLDATLEILETDVLSVPEIARNLPDRCYHCKKFILSVMAKRALTDGYSTLIDGTNASDDIGDRPGMKALQELSILSPLRLCGLTKSDIRRQSREAGLFTWDKPSYSCLATRIPSGCALTQESLERTERAEDFLFSLGLTDFRVRTLGTAAKIELSASQFAQLLRHRHAVADELKKSYDSVLLDLEARK